MGTAKLMTPLFYDGNYNVEKKRMRAVLEREVSNGAVSYRLWRSDGPALGVGMASQILSIREPQTMRTFSMWRSMTIWFPSG